MGMMLAYGTMQCPSVLFFGLMDGDILLNSNNLLQRFKWTQTSLISLLLLNTCIYSVLHKQLRSKMKSNNIIVRTFTATVVCDKYAAAIKYDPKKFQ